MTIEKLNSMIDEALEEGMEKGELHHITNTINASHALGKYHALLDIITELYGYDEMAKTHDRCKATTETLLKVAEKSYKIR